MGPLGAARLLMTYCQRSQKSVLSRLPKQVRKASRDSGEESPASLLNGKRTKNWLPPLISYRQSGCFVYKPRFFLSKWGSQWTLLQKMGMRIKRDDAFKPLWPRNRVSSEGSSFLVPSGPREWLLLASDASPPLAALSLWYFHSIPLDTEFPVQ